MAPKPTTSSETTPAALDAEGRALMKRWLQNWKRIGPILEAERWTRVRARYAADARVGLAAWCRVLESLSEESL
jgi:hypothetical protein